MEDLQDLRGHFGDTVREHRDLEHAGRERVFPGNWGEEIDLLDVAGAALFQLFKHLGSDGPERPVFFGLIAQQRQIRHDLLVFLQNFQSGKHVSPLMHLEKRIQIFRARLEHDAEPDGIVELATVLASRGVSTEELGKIHRRARPSRVRQAPPSTLHFFVLAAVLLQSVRGVFERLILLRYVRL